MALFNYGYGPDGYGYSQPTVINNPPAYGYPMMYGGNNGGLFGGNGDSWLGVLLLIALLGGGLGNWGNNGGGAGVGFVQDGFNQAALTNQLSAIQTGQTAGFSNSEVAACNRAMTAMQQNFASQTALDARLDNIAMNQATCCCDNKAAIQDVKYTIATDGALTRNTIDQAGQRLFDKLCQLELDGVKNQLEQSRRDNIDLQNRINLANLEASQLRQTQEIKDFVRPPINPSFNVPNPYSCYNNSNLGVAGNVIGAFA